MATRKMTFTIPEELAGQFLKRVPPRDRSRYVAGAIAAKLHEHNEQLIRACEIANGDPDVQAMERDFGALPDDLEEPWTNAPAR
jgi:hypothetical protein